MRRFKSYIKEDGHEDVASVKKQIKIAKSALEKMDGEMSKLNDVSKYYLFNEDLIGAFKLYGASINGIDDDVRLSKRLHIPSRRLRGFEAKRVGPIDKNDYVGGNYAVAANIEAALPNLLPESTQTDVSLFMDMANLWHTDYDSSVGQSSKIRSSVGVATNMFTPIGPLNFVLSQNLSKADSDQTESFRLQIGSSF